QAQPTAPRRPPSRPESSSIRLSIKAFQFPTPASSPSRWTLGAGATAAFGPAPVGLFGAGLFAEYQSRLSIPHSVLLGAEAAPYATASVQAATARYRWGASHAAACVQTLRFEASSTLWLCAEVVGGVAIVTGQARGPITHSRTVSEAWLSVGPAARVRFQISEAYSLDLAAGAGIPVIRHRTVFYEPRLVLHETGNLAGFLAIELGRRSGG
ncbi:MAG TPA: hypothetical protein VKP30_29785, partial [Polyangiaceae bacterium]|nr:hypothetical protein [Polyangiaceae bacterium]